MHLYPSTLQKDLLCVFQGPERKLLSKSRWPRIPMVLHYGPKSTHNVLQQHPSVRHPKQACQWWEIQQLYLTLKTEREKLIFSKSHAACSAASAFSYFVGHGVHGTLQPHILVCNHVYSVPVEKCSPIGLWEGLTTTLHVNELWQQLRTVRSHWIVEDGVEG